MTSERSELCLLRNGQHAVTTWNFNELPSTQRHTSPHNTSWTLRILRLDGRTQLGINELCHIGLTRHVGVVGFVDLVSVLRCRQPLGMECNRSKRMKQEHQQKQPKQLTKTNDSESMWKQRKQRTEVQRITKAEISVVVYSSVTICSPNRFTCMGFLLLSKGCIPGPHAFASFSGLASHSGCLGPHEFTPVFHSSFTLVCHSGCLGPHEFAVYTCLPHSSPTLVFHTCLALWVPWAAWVLHLSSICLPHLSPTLGALGRMSFTLVSDWETSVGDKCTLVQPKELRVGALGRRQLYTCTAQLSPTLVSHCWVTSGPTWVYTHVSHTCLPRLFLTTLGVLGRHEFTLMSAQSCFPHLSRQLWVTSVGRMSLGDTCKLPFVSHTCLPLWVSSVGRHEFTLMSAHLSPTLVSHSVCLGPTSGSLPIVNFHLRSHTCLPLWVDQCGRHEFTLVSHTHVGPHLSPTLVSHSGCKWADMSLHSCLPLVPHTWVTSVGRMSGTLVFQISLRDNCVFHSETSVNSCGPRTHEWETLVGKLVSHTCAGDTCNSCAHLSPTLGDKCGRHEFALVSHL